jgi:hypothetical protein
VCRYAAVPKIDDLIPTWDRHRAEWVKFLAYSEWNVKELASGEALRHGGAVQVHCS